MNNEQKKPHKHEAVRTVDVCACGATRDPANGLWVVALRDSNAGRTLASIYRKNSTPDERSANARKGAAARWKGKTKKAREEFMRRVASAPRPARRIADRCACGKYSQALAEKRRHRCKL